LQPTVPYRPSPAYEGLARHGYDLRVSRGPRLASDDPLLAVFGLQVAALEGPDAFSEDLQSAGFEPGSETRLSIEHQVDGTAVVAIWDLEHVRRAGELDRNVSAFSLAATEYGLQQKAVVLDEYRSMPDCVRVGLTILIFAEKFARISIPRGNRYKPPARPPRRRIILALEKQSGLQWWDSDTAQGPAPARELPVAPRLRDELARLDRKAAKLHKKRVRDPAGDAYELDPADAELRTRAVELWQSVRREVAATHIVGFLAPDMTAPAWDTDDPQVRSVDDLGFLDELDINR
jgi:hypothetical protein